jgi:hypothetical protein
MEIRAVISGSTGFHGGEKLVAQPLQIGRGFLSPMDFGELLPFRYHTLLAIPAIFRRSLLALCRSRTSAVLPWSMFPSGLAELFPTGGREPLSFQAIRLAGGLPPGTGNMNRGRRRLVPADRRDAAKCRKKFFHVRGRLSASAGGVGGLFPSPEVDPNRKKANKSFVDWSARGAVVELMTDRP